MPDRREAYWRAFEDYLCNTDNADVVLHDLGSDYFRAIRKQATTPLGAPTGSHHPLGMV